VIGGSMGQVKGEEQEERDTTGGGGAGVAWQRTEKVHNLKLTNF